MPMPKEIEENFMLSPADTKLLIQNTSVIVRAAGERTAETCVHLLAQMFPAEQVITIREVPFSRAVRIGFF